MKEIMVPNNSYFPPCGPNMSSMKKKEQKKKKVETRR